MAREAFLINPPRRRRHRINPLKYVGGKYVQVSEMVEKKKKRKPPKGYKFVPGEGMIKTSRKRKGVKEKMTKKSTKRSKAAKKAWRTRRGGTKTRKAAKQVKVRLGKRARGHVKSIRINHPTSNPGELFLVGNPRRQKRKRSRNVPSTNRRRRGYRRNPAFKVC